LTPRQAYDKNFATGFDSSLQVQQILEPQYFFLIKQLQQKSFNPTYLLCMKISKIKPHLHSPAKHKNGNG